MNEILQALKGLPAEAKLELYNYLKTEVQDLIKEQEQEQEAVNIALRRNAQDKV